MANGPQLRVFLAGRVAVEANGHAIGEAGFPGRQGRLLFAYLVTAQGRPVPRDELAEALWENGPPATWDKALTVIASRLRALLADSGLDGATALTGAFGCYRLELPEGTWVDVVAAAGAATAAEDALADGDLDNARSDATLAASLLQQPVLPGDDGEWVEEKRRELAEIRVRALRVLADACLHLGETAEAVKWAEELTAVEPFRESGYRRLMEAHVVAGNRAEALRVYERCRRLLADELGTYPSPETEELYRRLLEAPAAPEVQRPAHEGGNGRSSRGRRRAWLLAAGVLAGAVAAGAFALGSHGRHAPPKVLPNSLVRIDPHTLKPTQVVPVTDAPDLVVESGGFVWVTSHVLRDIDSPVLRNAGDRTLTRVDPSTGNAVVVGGGLAPCGLTADPSGDVWVANCYPQNAGPVDDVVRIDAQTLDFKQTRPLPGGAGYYRALAYGGGSLWASEIVGAVLPNESTVTQIDPDTGAEHAIDVIPTAGGLAWSGAYGDLWIAHFESGSLTRLHAATGAMKTLYDVGGNPALPIVDGDVVWVADWAAPRVVRVQAGGSPRTHEILLPVRNFAAVGWAVAAGAGAVWATTPRDGALWRIDPDTNAVRRIHIPFLPSGVAADDDAIWVTVRKP